MGEGKELCDLLVVFGNDVIIFSDKSCEFPDTGDLRLDWQRWWKRAIAASVGQIAGAERWIRNFPDRIFSDKRCTTKLDVAIPALNTIRIHRVIVATGAANRCKGYFGGGSGSLMIESSAHARLAPARPFTIADATNDDKFVHLLDEVCLTDVLSERDTAADFVEYLTKKEAAMTSKHFIAAGEEELLGHFLLTIGADGEHSFLPVGGENVDVFQIPQGTYEYLKSLPQYANSKTVNKLSYGWDRLIDYFTDSRREGRLLHIVPNEEFERCLRTMALPRRSERRALASMIFTLMQHPGPAVRTACRMLVDNAIALSGVSVPQPPGAPDEEYRGVRHQIMLAYARWVRIRFPNARQVLVLGFHAPHVGRASEDVALLDLSDWSEEIEAQTHRDMERFGWTASGEHAVEYEFPPPPVKQSKEQLRRLRQRESLLQKQAAVAFMPRAPFCARNTTDLTGFS